MFLFAFIPCVERLVTGITDQSLVLFSTVVSFFVLFCFVFCDRWVVLFQFLVFALKRVQTRCLTSCLVPELNIKVKKCTMSQ